MALTSAQKLVVVKAFAPSEPLPLDAREIYESLAAAQAYAKSDATAYAGQTVKVVEGNAVTVYTLVPSTTEGTNFDLKFTGGGTGSGVQDVTTSTVEGNVKVNSADGESTAQKDVPVVGALINPVVDEDAHTLTLTKVGATAEANTEVVVPLGGAAPDTMISAVIKGENGLKLKVTKFDVASETSTTEEIQFSGAVTDINTATAGKVVVSTMGENGAVAAANKALAGAVINAAYDATTKILTLPVVTGVGADGAVTTTPVTVDLKVATANAIIDVAKTADTETNSAKTTYTYKDATGAEKTKDIYESGVRKVEAGETVDKIKITTADENGTLTASQVLIGAGNVKNPTYDAETRKITLPILQADATTTDLVINLGKDMVVKSGAYNTATKAIELVLTDNTKISINAADLIDIYTGKDTQTATVSVSDSNEITVNVKISTDAKNLVKVDAVNGGLKVVEADFVDTKKLISDETAAREAKIGDIGEKTVKQYVDEAKEAASTTFVDFGTTV